MYDILAYLFEHCKRHDLHDDGERVTRKLAAAGFEEDEIGQALHWLSGVQQPVDIDRVRLSRTSSAARAYSASETGKLDAQCLGYLITLESCGILDPVSREQVLERAMAASGESLTVAQFKLVVLMVLWNEGTTTTRLIAEDLFNPAIEDVKH